MSRYGQRAIEVAGAQNLDLLAVVLEDADRHQRLDVDGVDGHPGEICQVDGLVLDAIQAAEAAPVRQLLDQRQLAALEVRRNAAAGPGLLALLALASRGAPARAEAPADATALAMCPRRGCKLMESHSDAPSVFSGVSGATGAASISSTTIRCWMANTIPRIFGLSGRTTV